MKYNFENLITAFVDNEITDAGQKNEIELLIQSETSAAYEFNVQSLMKNIVQTKCPVTPISLKNKNKIIRRLKAENIPSLKSILFIENLFARPVFSYGIAAVILVLLMYWVFTPVDLIPDYVEIAAKQQGEFNLFLQANNNFNSITEGRLEPQIISGNPEVIQNFFVEQGVNYTTFIPLFKEWNLLGAVVSEDKGEKFAHHVYANEEGKIVYVYQVEEHFIVNEQVLTLTNEMINVLNNEGCFKISKNNVTTIITKIENNICAIVSNENIAILESNFCINQTI